MSIKMKELSQRSKESKSTILYYVKEGLLPEPSKPKPNVHLYDDKCVDIIRFIKYLQGNFSYTISQIKDIFKHNNLDLNGSFEMMIKSLEIATIGRNGAKYSTQEFLKIANISHDELDEYLEKRYIFKRDGHFGEIELEMIEILKKSKELNLDIELIESYAHNAQKMAQTESKAGARMFESSGGGDSRHYEILFDLVLKLKPYIYNMHTVAKYYQEKRRTDNEELI